VPQETFFNLPQEKRQKLIDVLLDEFAENDYKAVSVSRIVERAGIAKGSFYQYFADKKDCYLYLVQLGVDEKMAFLRQIPAPQEVLDIFAYLRWLLDAGLQFEFSNPRLAKISYRAVFDDVPLPEATLGLIRQSGMVYFRQLLQQGLEAGDVRTTADPEVAAFIFNVIFTNLGQYLMERFDIDPAQLLMDGPQAFDRSAARQSLTQVINILEYGLRKPQKIQETP
jgi:AcrR family transcriptional regulator